MPGLSARVAQSVVIVDGQTNVVTGIVPDVIAHQS